MSILLDCHVICNLCGVASMASLAIGYSYADGCYSVLTGDMVIFHGIKMKMNSTLASCEDTEACAARKKAKEGAK